MPGLDCGEAQAWQSYLDSTLRIQVLLNRVLTERHQLTLADVRLLDLLDTSTDGSVRMGDVAEALAAQPSRVTRQIRRLEADRLVMRTSSPHDGRAVLATITADGREAVAKAMQTYGDCVRACFLGELSRSQATALGESCRRIGMGLRAGAPALLGRG